MTIDDADYEFAALYTRPEYRERVRQAYVPYMESVVAFFEFWYDFIVGDDWHVAAGIVLALALTALLARTAVPAWWLMPLAAISLLSYSLWRTTLIVFRTFMRARGFSWIHRWSKTKGMPSKGEPEPPPGRSKAYEAR